MYSYRLGDSWYGTRRSTPKRTSFFSRSDSTWRVIPSDASNASNRRLRKKHSRKIKRLQRSPITATERESEQGSSSSVFHFINVSNHFGDKQRISKQAAKLGPF